jgi:ribonuclease HIII
MMIIQKTEQVMIESDAEAGTEGYVLEKRLDTLNDESGSGSLFGSLTDSQVGLIIMAVVVPVIIIGFLWIVRSRKFSKSKTSADSKISEVRLRAMSFGPQLFMSADPNSTVGDLTNPMKTATIDNSKPAIPRRKQSIFVGEFGGTGML